MPERTEVALRDPVRTELVAVPASVAAARWFVAHEVALWDRSLVDDAELCVSELAGNAAVHTSSSVIEVALKQIDGGVRLSVTDDGPEPLDVGICGCRDGLGGLDGPGEELDALDLDALDLDGLDAALTGQLTSGRGLAIVSCLAAAWGVEPTASGKRVWLELRG